LAYSKNREFGAPSYIPLAQGGRDDLVDSSLIATVVEEFEAQPRGNAHPNWSYSSGVCGFRDLAAHIATQQ
jgi:hypothetical protein